MKKIFTNELYIVVWSSLSREEELTYEQIEGIFSAVSSREKKKTGVKLNGSVWMKSVNERATEIL
jgi:hypothetical protein